MYDNIEIVYNGSQEGLEKYAETLGFLVSEISVLENGINADEGHRDIYTSSAKVYEIPLDKADSMLEKLDIAIKDESSRINVFGGMRFKTPDESCVSGYDSLSMSHARELGEYTGVRDLEDSTILIYTEAVPIRDDKFDFGILTGVDYVTIKAKDQCVIAVMTPQAGLASNPEISDKILSEYASKIVEVRKKE